MRQSGGGETRRAWSKARQLAATSLQYDPMRAISRRPSLRVAHAATAAEATQQRLRAADSTAGACPKSDLWRGLVVSKVR